MKHGLSLMTEPKIYQNASALMPTLILKGSSATTMHSISENRLYKNLANQLKKKLLPEHHPNKCEASELLNDISLIKQHQTNIKPICPLV